MSKIGWTVGVSKANAIANDKKRAWRGTEKLLTGSNKLKPSVKTKRFSKSTSNKSRMVQKMASLTP